MSVTPVAAMPRFDITLAGETNLDLILYGLPEQMPTERELLGSGFEVTLGGSSSILAHNLAKLGSKVGFVTEVGGDDLGAIALRFLEESAVDLSCRRLSSEKSTGVTLVLPHGDRRHILTYPGVMAEMMAAELPLEYLKNSKHFHLSSVFLQRGLQDGLPEVFAELKRAGLTLSLDTNDDPAGEWDPKLLNPLLDQIDVLLPNEDELMRIARRSTVDEALEILSHRVPLVVVKCGGRGAIVQQGSTRTVVAPVRVAPVDTIGAGDSFDAGFLHRYVRGEDPLQAAAFGNRTGALSTQRAGGVEAFRNAELVRELLHDGA